MTTSYRHVALRDMSSVFSSGLVRRQLKRLLEQARRYERCAQDGRRDLPCTHLPQQFSKILFNYSQWLKLCANNCIVKL
jgi:hypothetical protein